MTQMEYARQGTVTDAMKTVAADEGLDPEQIRAGVAEGTIVIPANINHKRLHARGIGLGLKTKMNVNLGISKDHHDYEEEKQKAQMAEAMKADALMDLSCWGKTAEFRRWIIDENSLAVGTVPMYDAVGLLDKGLKDMTADDLFRVVEEHARDGVDFMTIHAGMNRETAQHVRKNPRITSLVSRGGSILFAWMYCNGKENPFYEQFDRLLDICRHYDVTLSLGDACRSGCGHDSTDAVQISELIILGELTQRARKAGVQVMIEGPGHMPVSDIRMNVELAKKLCHGAPLYVLGPIVTDIAPGYDHITAAIGGALSASYGADFLCYVTPAEHLRLPDLDDVREGIIASRIACHAADLAKKVPHASDWDDEMSRARRKVDFETMTALAIDPEKARRYRASSIPEEENTCTMCGPMCPMKTMESILAGREIKLN